MMICGMSRVRTHARRETDESLRNRGSGKLLVARLLTRWTLSVVYGIVEAMPRPSWVPNVRRLKQPDVTQATSPCRIPIIYERIECFADHTTTTLFPPELFTGSTRLDCLAASPTY